MEKALSDKDEYRMLDGLLHFKIAEISRNSILEKMYKGLHALIEEYIQAIPDPTAGFEWHVRLVDAIAEGNAGEARDVMRKSLYVDKPLRETLEKSTSGVHDGHG
jgi:DNA-binding FadR family transcriptional regulator